MMNLSFRRRLCYCRLCSVSRSTHSAGSIRLSHDAVSSPCCTSVRLSQVFLTLATASGASAAAVVYLAHNAHNGYLCIVDCYACFGYWEALKIKMVF
ncbi:hypothetical protein RJT34_09678 [Clitoria ternatea]|uniref:Uncharacterized protein n=1 Tax=Clitoria ternatea TaxID=43366 RepID=A0AAN9K7K2_CLITE